MDSLFSNNVAVVSVCITVLILIVFLSKFTNGFKISKDGLELAKNDGEMASREVMRESLADADIRLEYLHNVLVRKHPKEDIFIKWICSEIRNCLESFTMFNSVEDTEEYKKYRWTTLETKIKSLIKPDWEFPYTETYENFCSWVSVVTNVKRVKGVK